MTKEMVISANRHETKVAILEDDQLVEVYFQRANEYSLAGSIHKGRVTRVLPGMQSAFVDLGLERDTFLYVSDFFEENEDFEPIAGERETRGGREQRAGGREGREERPPREGREERPPREGREERPPREERRGREPREERPLREERPVEERQEPRLAEAAAVETPPAMEPGLEAPAQDASTEPPAGRPDRESDRDRHRRSRRRRNRGRGFPESKYASPHSFPERTGPEPAQEPSTPAAEQSSYEFPVLPGESLAKYRRTAVQTLDSGEQEELGDDSPGLNHTVDQAMPEDVADESETALNESEERPANMTDAVIVASSAPSAADEAEAAADREAVIDEHSEVDELVAEALSEAAEATERTPEAEADAEAPPDFETPAEIAERQHSNSAELPQAEAAELEPDEAAAPEGESETAADSIGEGDETADMAGLAPGDVESPSEAAHDTEPTPDGASAAAAPAEAAVREHGGRYMQHRISRRMRRKLRAQGRNEPAETAPAAAPEPAPKAEPKIITRPERGPAPSITDLLKEGQEILVQIAKEPLGQKGARITSHIALPGRYVVYMPTLEHMGVSRKIASDEERLRLKRILQAHRAGIQGGFIVRTAGEGRTEDEIAADMNFLANLWLDIRQKAEKKPAPVLLHHDLDIVQRLLRDQFTDNFKAIWVDNEDVYESILRFVQRFQPSLVSRVKMYTRPAPIFDAFNITPELEKALRPKVWLKSGGYIVINQTEALVAIDVNTGKFVGKSNRLEDTIVKTNTEAVKEIVRQIRLRDLGGIIVVDFIDMDERKNRQKVMQALEEAMRADKAPYKILQFNDFGLVAITRKRVKQSLERALCSPCPYCEGAGYVKSVPTIISEILQEAGKLAPAIEGDNVILRVNPEVAKTLKSTQNRYLEELEAILRRPVLVKGDPLLHVEKFDLA
jgi:ribonuclease G